MGANGYDRTYHSDPYERTYSNIPRGYERTYSNLPRGYERTYSNVPGYERTYSNDEYYPSQHDKYPPMKPHDPKYPSPHNTPKPSAWKKKKTPKPTAWKSPKPMKAKKTPKPTKAEKTPKPTVWKSEKTPKPTWHKVEKTPKPTVWKSSHDKAPKHYSMNEEEEENDEATGYLDSVMNFSPYGFDMCYLNDGEECTPVFSFRVGPNTGCYCRSGCCESGRCVAKKPDYIGVPYCPSECRGGFLEPTGTC